jgi:hypothetical protein
MPYCYWMTLRKIEGTAKLREETLDSNVWRIRFGIDYGLVVRRAIERECMILVGDQLNAQFLL